jgi:hypothetical protein
MEVFEKKQAPEPETPSRRRLVEAAVILVCVLLTVWYCASQFDYPAWFLALLISLLVIDLSVWVFAPQQREELLACKKCARKRVPDDWPCPQCGGKGFRLPMLNRIAVALVIVFFAAYGVFFVWGGVQRDQDHIIEGVGYLLLALLVGAEVTGAKLARPLKALLNRFFPSHEPQREEMQRVKHRRYPAIQVIVLILSIVVLALAVALLIHLG